MMEETLSRFDMQESLSRNTGVQARPPQQCEYSGIDSDEMRVLMMIMMAIAKIKMLNMIDINAQGLNQNGQKKTEKKRSAYLTLYEMMCLK